MRAPWFALFRALLNVNFGISALRHQFRRRHRLWEPLLIGLSVAMVVGVVGLVIVSFSRTIILAAAEIGQPEIVLTLAHLAASMVVFFFGIAFVMSAFYFSDDAALLMSWPLRPREILSAKFAAILVSEYLTIAVLLLPVYFAYSLYVPVNWIFFLSALVVFLLIPVVPLALAALLVVVLMRFVSISRRRDFFTMVGSLLGLAVAVGFQYLAQSQLDMSEADLLQFIASSSHGLSQLAARGYPPILWSMLALGEAGTAKGWAALGGYVGAGLVAFAGLLVAGEALFLRAAQATGESRARRSRSSVPLDGGSPIRSVARAERKTFVRTPIYVFNGFAGPIIVPFIMVLTKTTDGEAIAAITRAGLVSPVIGVIVIWGWMALAAGLSVIPATAVSREGRTLWIYRSLPLSGREFFLGKLLGAESMIVAGAIPGVLVLAFVMKMPLGAVLLGLLLGTFTSVLVSMACLTIDMHRPWLTWTEPARAIKSNLNGLFGLLVSAVLVGVPVWFGIVVSFRGVGIQTVMAAVVALNALALVGLWQWLAPRLDELLERMGE